MSNLKEKYYLASLKEILNLIKQYDKYPYDIRYKYIIEALYLAQKCNYKIGFDIDIKQNDNKWIVVYIDLPTGQVSWHMPTYSNLYNKGWDGHSTEEKFFRIDKFIKNNL